MFFVYYFYGDGPDGMLTSVFVFYVAGLSSRAGREPPLCWMVHPLPLPVARQRMQPRQSGGPCYPTEIATYVAESRACESPCEHAHLNVSHTVPRQMLQLAVQIGLSETPHSRKKGVLLHGERWCQ